jgi:hypothetical protein
LSDASIKEYTDDYFNDMKALYERNPTLFFSIYKNSKKIDYDIFKIVKQPRKEGNFDIDQVILTLKLKKIEDSKIKSTVDQERMNGGMRILY